jgi:glycosyltransferase involved in cell wall biosynthesis
MKIAFITRSTLYTVPGGDTVQVVQTAQHLAGLDVNVEIRLSNEVILYEAYNLLHFFNITRPADILYHIKRSKKPFVVSTILCDYSEYDQIHRKGAGRIFAWLPANTIEYIKTVARWLLGKDQLVSLSYLWKGQRKSIMQILRKAAIVLPNSESEYKRLVKAYPIKVNYKVVPNGIDAALFHGDADAKKDKHMVLCVARVEGIKNQYNLIRTLNNTRFNLMLIGSHAPNQADYYRLCRSHAAANISFMDHIPQDELVKYYQQAKVHVLPSWFETTGLTSLEAAVMRCNIVITAKGDTREYFGNEAFYCEPDKPESILAAVKKASEAAYNENLRQKILKQYTWEQAAIQTLKAYQSVAIA